MVLIFWFFFDIEILGCEKLDEDLNFLFANESSDFLKDLEQQQVKQVKKEKDKNIFNFAVKNIEAGLEKKQKYYFFKRQKIRDEVSVNFSQPVRAVETT